MGGWEDGRMGGWVDDWGSDLFNWSELGLDLQEGEDLCRVFLWTMLLCCYMA